MSTKITILAPELRPWLGFHPPKVSRTDTDTMAVEVPMRNLTNEYAVKWYILRDGLLENRTDGALVRVITPVQELDVEGAADRRLVEFVSAIYPRLGKFVPS